MRKKADVKISLHFIVGLIFSVILILIVLGGVKRLSDITDPHYERDVVDQWVEDIELINQEPEVYITELLSIKEVKGEYLFFIFQQTSTEILGEDSKNNFQLRKPSTCSRSSCICVYSMDSNKFEHCEKIGADAISFYRVPYDSDNYYVIGNDEFEIQDNNFVVINDAVKVSNDGDNAKLVVSNNVFAYRNADRITFCFELENQKCIA